MHARTLPAIVLLSGLAVQPALGVPPVLTTVSAASYQGFAVAPGSIAATFGLDLATATETAASTPLPESLAGTSVKVTDSAGAVRTAPLLFVSPGQINYIVPEGTAEGSAVITVTHGSVVQSGSVTIRNAAPGMFSANEDGKGVAAAIAIRVAGDQTLETRPVHRFDSSQSRYVPAPIEMGADSHRVFLSLYGTGIRHANVVTATILGRPAPISWRGAHSVYAGLDQVNIEVPRSLLGRGTLSVRLSADGAEANPVAFELQHSTYLNLDYETTSRGRLWTWGTPSSGYEYAVDTSVAYSGNQSLRIRYVNAATSAFGNTYLSLPAESARGKHIRFSSYIKADSVNRGAAGLWLRVDGTAGTLSIDNAYVPKEAAEWQVCTIDRDVNPDATQIVLGVLHTGDGTAWFDKMSLDIDGVPFPEPPAPVVGEPTAAQLDWVRSTAIPLVTPDAGHGFDDLEPVRDIVGTARIVALGEATHGTSEFFRTKHRLLEFLATRMGFTIFAIEANMPEAYRLNEYVLTGRGDPRRLLAGMYFWTWNTQEVLDMILWMRQFNASGAGRIQFTGFDMQTATVAMEVLRGFVSRAEPAYLASVDSVWSQARAAASSSAPASQVEAAAAAVRAVWQHLDQNRSSYSGFSDADVEWAVQNGKIVEQATYVKIGGSNYRDISMAANMEWILKQNPGAKAVVWAHNGHVCRLPGWMGSYLDQTFGEDYRVFGFVFHEGRYNAINRYPGGSLTANLATPSFPGSVEYVFHTAGIPQFILDLRKADATTDSSGWLLREILYRDIGAVANDGFRSTNRLGADFDALIHFDETTPSVLLPF